MRRPILLDNPPPSPLPSDRWSRFLESRYLSMGGLAAGGVAAVIGASVALAMLLPFVVAPDAPAQVVASDIGAAPVGPAALSGAGVQYVGDVKQADRPCEEQTWPYIAARCLKPAADQKPAAAKVAVDRSELKTMRAGIVPSAPAAAETPTAPPEQKLVVAAPEIAPPLPAARPAPRPARDQVSRDDSPQKRVRSATAGEPTNIRPDVRAEARRAYASSPPSDRDPSPVVRRWTEAEYNVPGPFGATRRVVVIRPQSIHQAAAFSDER